MKTSMARRLVGAAIVLAAAIFGYWYFSPHLVLYQMQQAAMRGDADGINDHVDYPALRESLRGQLSAMMTDRMGELKDNPFAALGSMMATAMANQLIDAIVRPEVLGNAIVTGQMRLQEGASKDASTPDDSKRGRFTIERQGASRIIARPTGPNGQADDNAPSFVFERRGFADWKLTELRMQGGK